MATHSGILAWEISWTEEPGKLQSMRSQRVGHDWACTHTHTKYFKSMFNTKNWLTGHWRTGKVKQDTEVTQKWQGAAPILGKGNKRKRLRLLEHRSLEAGNWDPVLCGKDIGCPREMWLKKWNQLPLLGWGCCWVRVKWCFPFHFYC